MVERSPSATGILLSLSAVLGCATPTVTAQAEPLGDTGVSYRELDEAAKGACKYIWDYEPDAQRFEFCGLLYRDGDGIRVGLPLTRGLIAECWPPEEPPKNTIFLGKYHNHRLTPEPSDKDMRRARKYPNHPNLGHYLCSPSGIVRRFSATEGTVIVR